MAEVGGRVYMSLRSLHGKKRRSHAWSDDGGSSWSRIQLDESLPEPPAHGSILSLDDKRLLFVNPASDQAREKQTARISEDQGQTWSTAELLYEGSSAYSDLAKTADGTVLCLFEAEGYSKMILARVEAVEPTHGGVKSQ